MGLFPKVSGGSASLFSLSKRFEFDRLAIDRGLPAIDRHRV